MQMMRPSITEKSGMNRSVTKRDQRGPRNMDAMPIRANKPMIRVEYSYGGAERRKVRVVQKLVKVMLVQKPTRQAWTRSGWVTNIWRMV